MQQRLIMQFKESEILILISSFSYTFMFVYMLTSERHIWCMHRCLFTEILKKENE